MENEASEYCIYHIPTKSFKSRPNWTLDATQILRMKRSVAEKMVKDMINMANPSICVRGDFIIEQVDIAEIILT